MYFSEISVPDLLHALNQKSCKMLTNKTKVQQKKCMKDIVGNASRKRKNIEFSFGHKWNLYRLKFLFIH